MKNLKHPAILQILESGKDFIQHRVDLYILTFKDEKTLTEIDIESYRQSIQYDIIRSMANYLLVTDKINSCRFYFSKGTIEIQILVERDGKEYGINTQVIVAYGEIQRPHYRYLVKTPLKKINSPLIKKLKGIEKAELDVKYSQEVVGRYEDELNDILNIDINNFCLKRSYHFREYKKCNKTVEDFLNDRSFNKELLEGEFSRFKLDSNLKRVKLYLKDAKKNLDKKNIKLEAAKAAL